MSLLVLEEVSMRFRRGRRSGRERVALRSVSLEVAEGELVAVWGGPRSGRTTLLQVAGGVVPPSAGVVRFAGVDLVRRLVLGAPGGIGFASTCFRRVIGDSALEHVAAPLMGCGYGLLAAQSRAFQALKRVEAVACAELDADDLSPAEAIRVALARALTTQPRLLLVDEPLLGVPPARDRDATLTLLRSIAHRDRVSVLMTVGSGTELAGSDRALSIDDGQLRGPLRPEPARVIELRPDRNESSA